jgi:hypothetical protein
MGYKFKISCGMTLGAHMKDAMGLFTKKTAIKLSFSIFSWTVAFVGLLIWGKKSFLILSKQGLLAAI